VQNRISKAFKLYEVMMTRQGSYEHLVKAMEESHQTGVAEILKEIDYPSKLSANISKGEDERKQKNSC